VSVYEHSEVGMRPTVRAEPADAGFPTRIVLQPIAAPSVLGWFGFAGATFVVGAWMAGWFGSPASPDYLFPFAALVGGLAQLVAGAWSFRARDTLAAAMHGIWGAFWLGYGVLWALFATGNLIQPVGTFSSLGYWFLALAAITASGAIAALARSVPLFMLLASLTGGAIVAAAGYLADSDSALTVAGYFLVISAVAAWYEATAMLLADSFGRVMLPLGAYTRDENVPGQARPRPIEWPLGEPGIKHGQ
jgi:uncharacterized protein